MIEGIMPVGNLNVPVIGTNVPTAQLAAVAQQIGPLFNRVVLAPLGTGATDVSRNAAVVAATKTKYPLVHQPGLWRLPGAQWIDQDDPDELIRFAPVPGVTATLTCADGTPVTYTRAGSAPVVVNGVELTATANQARVDADGLLIEPACTNIFTHADDMTNVSWVVGTAATITGSAADPLGGTTAFTMLNTNTSATHYVYELLAVPASQSAVSVYVKANGCNWFMIASNSHTYMAAFDLANGIVYSYSGTGVTAEIESIGNGWFRCTMLFAAGTALISFASADTSAHLTTSWVGDPTKGVYLWRPQAEAGQYASSWTATTRAADVATFVVPQIGPEWSVEVVATPCGGYWNRGANMPLFQIGVNASGNSIYGYVNAGAAVCSVYDNATAEKHAASDAMTVGAASHYWGQRRITFQSLGLARPAVSVDGMGAINAASGAGSGVFSGGQILTLQLGSNGTLYGGFKIRSIRVLNKTKPTTRPTGSYNYLWPCTRVSIVNSHCIAFLGDSITAGVYDVSITAPYPAAACATLGATYTAHNYGVGGNCTQNALDRYLLDIIGRGYTKMVLFCGVNDINYNVDPNATIANLTRIMDLAAADGTTVYPVTILPGGYTPGGTAALALTAINTAIRAYATAHSLHLIEANVDFDDGTGAMKAAYLLSYPHPTQAGQTELATLCSTALAL